MHNHLKSKVNLHVHSTFSDGGDAPIDMIQAAIHRELEYLGFADHFSPKPSPWLYPGCYLTPNDVKHYINHLKALKDQYQSKIKLLVGLEIFIVEDTMTSLPIREFDGLDFLLVEDLHDDADLVTNLTQLRTLMPYIPIGLAHFDFSQVQLSDLVPTLESLEIFIELNSAYSEYYRRSEGAFRVLADTDVILSIGSDAHDLKEIGNIGDPLDFLIKMGIESRLTDLLELLSTGIPGPANLEIHGNNMLNDRITTQKVLFVCEQNRLRSPTAQQVYSNTPWLESRSAGISGNANVHVTRELLEWADIIFVMERPQRNRIRKQFPDIYTRKRIICLYIPDDYEFMDVRLLNILKYKLIPYLGKPVEEQVKD